MGPALLTWPKREHDLGGCLVPAFNATIGTSALGTGTPQVEKQPGERGAGSRMGFYLLLAFFFARL